MGIMKKKCQDPKIKQPGFNGKKKRAGVFIHFSTLIEGQYSWDISSGTSRETNSQFAPEKWMRLESMKFPCWNFLAEPLRVQTLSLREL